MPRAICAARHLRVCIAVGVLSATTAFAQEALHNLAGQVELVRLVDLCAQTLGLKIEYDPKILQGATVTVRLREGIPNDELWLVTNQLLSSRGFATVQMPGSELISVIKIASAQGLARLETGDFDAASAGYVTVLYELRHRDVKEITSTVQPLLSKPGGAIAALGQTNLVLISDFKPRVDQAMDLIERLDVPSDDAVLETIPVENLPASQLTGLISTAATAYAAISGDQLKGKLIAVPDGNAVVLVAPVGEVNQWRSMIDRFDTRQALETRTYVPQHFSSQEVASLVEPVARDPGPRGSGNQWELITDDLTGTLIITATPTEHAQIESLIERLDSVPVAARRPVRAFPIRNRSVTEILDVLNRLVEAGVLEANEMQTPQSEEIPPARQQTERQVLPPGAEAIMPPTEVAQQQARPSPTAASSRRPGARGARGGEEPPLTLTADEGTNTLIAVGEARRLDQLAELIRTLDVRQPQVMLEVLLLVLTDTQTLDLGVEMAARFELGSTTFNLASLFGLEVLNTEGDIGAKGGTALILSPGDFSILINALETFNQGRSLNLPKVLVSNNQEATLDSVLQQPFTSTNASTTVATTSFGGTQDAGTTLTVRPQIAEGDHLLLEYTVALSQFVGDSTDPNIPPPRQQNTLTSVATVPDGYVIAVGGLKTLTETEAVSQVPLLGDIPLLGEAFKNRSNNVTLANFYVFIKVGILRQNGFEDLKYISDREVIAADVDDGWPHVEPRLIR